MSIFRKKPKQPKNELKSVIFTDSTLKSLTADDKEVVLSLVDYCDSLLDIRFYGVSRIFLLPDEPVDGVGIRDVSLRWNGDCWIINLKDHSDETVLELSYENADLCWC